MGGAQLGARLLALAAIRAAAFVRTSRAARPTVDVRRGGDVRRATETDAATGEDTMLYNVKGPTTSGADEGLPWWWDGFWSLPFTKEGEPGTELTLGDTMRIFKANIEQIYGDAPSSDGAPLAEGDISGLADGTLYLGLHEYARRFGPVYKLCFGPKSFIVLSDAVLARHVLATNNRGYNKGVLAEILEDIMGKGLIPADPVTWSTRRRAIVPAFHKRWLKRMLGMFAEKTDALTANLADVSEPVDLEERFGSLALDIIGSAVFNYEFDSVEKPSRVVQAAIDTLREAEHRSMTPAPYWKIPGAMQLVPRQRAFVENMNLLNDQLNAAIAAALADRVETDTEALQESRDYESLENPSLLRFLVDQRGEEATDTQLRDDLMTMLIAGHETTASALTWCVFELAQNRALLAELRAELDAVLPDGGAPATRDDVERLELTRLTVAESLRMYPQPPLLIRRAVDDDRLPARGPERGTENSRSRPRAPSSPRHIRVEGRGAAADASEKNPARRSGARDVRRAGRDAARLGGSGGKVPRETNRSDDAARVGRLPRALLDPPVAPVLAGSRHVRPEAVEDGVQKPKRAGLERLRPGKVGRRLALPERGVRGFRLPPVRRRRAQVRRRPVRHDGGDGRARRLPAQLRLRVRGQDGHARQGRDQHGRDDPHAERPLDEGVEARALTR